MEKKLKEVISKVLGVPVGKIANGFSQDTCEKWDSLHHLDLVIALEQEFGISFEPEEITELLSLKAIQDCLENKL